MLAMPSMSASQLMHVRIRSMPVDDAVRASLANQPGLYKALYRRNAQGVADHQEQEVEYKQADTSK